MASSKGRLYGKTALVTGASSGLGREICFAYADEGANIYCVDLYQGQRDAINLDTGKANDFSVRLSPSAENLSTVEALMVKHGSKRIDGKEGIRFSFGPADVTKASEVEAAVRTCVEIFGRIDILVNNAGISVESTHVKPLKVHETSELDYDKTMNINAKGVFLGCKYALKQMIEQEPVDWDEKGEERKTKWDRGWIINTASIQGFVGYYGTPSYCASKGAVVMLTRQIALDYGSYRIHSNALCPGFMLSGMTQNLQSSPEALATISNAHPFGGIGDVKEVARVAVFLASRDAAWISGVPLPVDGGYTAI